MLNPIDSVRSLCADLDANLLERHFRRMPAAYFERYSAADIARHLRQLATIDGARAVDVEFRSLASHAYEILVVGRDHTGTVACVTASLVTLGFDLEDVQVASYLSTDADGGSTNEPDYFVIVLRVSGQLHGRSAAAVAAEMRDRLARAFTHLAQGNILEAQTAAANTAGPGTEVAGRTPQAPTPKPAETSHDGLLLGGDYRLQRKLAVGGMGEVYLAVQHSLNRTVAVKLMHYDDVGGTDLPARFYQEGLVLGRFTCPNIVQILAAGSVRGLAGGNLAWMAMEYMAGGDLARWQAEHGIPGIDLAVRWFRQALEGLQYAHRHGILHRDLKPHNLLLTSEGHLKVSDFGLLKQSQAGDPARTPQAAVMGTPQYMSPEQAQGESVDERSDIFSLGATFFQMLSGKLPFDKPTAAALLAQIAQEDAPYLLDVQPRAPLPLAVLLRRMMARKRDERYQDVGVILEDLASYERRGLLQSAEHVALFSGSPFSDPLANSNLETRLLKPAPENADDVVI